MQAVLPSLWSWPAAATAAGHAGPAAGDVRSDEVLLRDYRRGDESAFRALYARHRDRLWRVVRRLVDNAAQAEEVAQETWLAVVAGRDAFAERARFSTWLFAIAHRRAADRLRRVGRHLETPLDAQTIDALPATPESDPGAIAEQDEAARRLQRAIALLPLAQREAFLLRTEGGLDVAEVALAMGCPAETAKTRLRYAYARLRQSLEAAG